MPEGPVPLQYSSIRPRSSAGRFFDAAGAAGKKELAIGLLLLAICVLISIVQPRFLLAENLQNQARHVGLSGIYSIGLGIVIITGGIDLSVGSAFALQGVLLSMMLRGDAWPWPISLLVPSWHWPWPLATLAAFALMAGIGSVHAFFITKLRLQPFIVTLCGYMFYRSMARYVADENTKAFGVNSYGWLKPLASGSLGPVPMPFVLLVIVAVTMWVVLHHSVYGRYLYAVGRNEEAARYSGIRTRWVIGSAYVVSMMLAGISGIMFAFDTPSISPDAHGTNSELFGIAAAVLGGCSLRGGEGSVLGIVLGVILLQVLRNGVQLLEIPDSLELAVTATVILIGVTADELISRRRAARKPGDGPPAAAMPLPPAAKD